MDRGYLDFERLFKLHEANAYYIVRSKKNLRCRRIYSKVADKTLGIRCDQIVKLTGFYSNKNYPMNLRRIKFYDSENDQYLVFLTNNFCLPALTIAELYRNRWQIELFFKWIKGNLKIKSFYGTSLNAVKTQVWIAICAYLTVAIMKKQLEIQQSLYTILQIVSVSLFEKVPIYQLLRDTNNPNKSACLRNQLTLFDF